jgi:hypothetical protein
MKRSKLSRGTAGLPNSLAARGDPAIFALDLTQSLGGKPAPSENGHEKVRLICPRPFSHRCAEPQSATDFCHVTPGGARSDALDRDSVSVRGQRFEIRWIGSQDGSARLGHRHDQSVHCGAAPSASAEHSGAPRQALRDCFDDLTGLQ